MVPATNTHKLTLHDNQSVKCSNFSFYSKNKVQFSPLNDGVIGGDMRDNSAEILFQSFLQEALVSSSGMGRNVHSLMLSTSAFPLPTTVSPTPQSALKYGFEEAVFVCDMPNRCKSPSHDSCQNRFLWTHQEVDLTPHPVVHQREV